MSSLKKYINIIEGCEGGRHYTALGQYEIMATDIQHAAFLMDKCEIDYVDIGVQIETIEAAELDEGDIDPILN